jgi:hypothetical protein
MYPIRSGIESNSNIKKANFANFMIGIEAQIDLIEICPVDQSSELIGCNVDLSLK